MSSAPPWKKPAPIVEPLPRSCAGPSGRRREGAIPRIDACPRKAVSIPMVLEQFYLNCLAHASYIVADESTHRAVVVDPQRDIGIYLAFAAEHDVRLEHVVL